MKWERAYHCSICIQNKLYVFGGAMRMFEDESIDDCIDYIFKDRDTIEQLALTDDLSASNSAWKAFRPKNFPPQNHMFVI